VATHDELCAAAWGDEPWPEHALVSLVKRLRRRLEPLALDVLTVQGRGYLLAIRHPTAT
jgi:DNA-binding winged helix-turn-helix (wHTH) protein